MGAGGVREGAGGVRKGAGGVQEVWFKSNLKKTSEPKFKKNVSGRKKEERKKERRLK